MLFILVSTLLVTICVAEHLSFPQSRHKKCLANIVALEKDLEIGPFAGKASDRLEEELRSDRRRSRIVKMACLVAGTHYSDSECSNCASTRNEYNWHREVPTEERIYDAVGYSR
jgi:hypothetical protein